jgi:hypothetical protein
MTVILSERSPQSKAMRLNCLSMAAQSRLEAGELWQHRDVIIWLIAVGSAICAFGHRLLHSSGGPLNLLAIAGAFGVGAVFAFSLAAFAALWLDKAVRLRHSAFIVIPGAFALVGGICCLAFFMPHIRIHDFWFRFFIGSASVELVASLFFAAKRFLIEPAETKSPDDTKRHQDF